MNKLLFAGLLVTVTTVAQAEFQAQTYWDDPHANRTVSEDVSEPTDHPNTLRFSVNGFGRLGMKARSEMINGIKSKRGEIYGANLDLQYNLLPTEDFNLWAGVGFGFTPNLHLATLKDGERYTEGNFTAQYDIRNKIDLESYDFRLMLVPEVKLCDSLALGLRLGAGMTWYRADIHASSLSSLTGQQPLSESASDTERDYVLYGLVGAQATWSLTECFSFFVYCDARFSDDVELKYDGEKYGEIYGSSLDFGAGFAYTF